MSCNYCGCVEIPGSNPKICPECYVDKHPISSAVPNLGLEEQELSIDELAQMGVRMLNDPIGSNELRQFSFHLVDLTGDVGARPRAGGPTIVWAEDRWSTWDEYMSVFS